MLLINCGSSIVDLYFYFVSFFCRFCLAKAWQCKMTAIWQINRDLPEKNFIALIYPYLFLIQIKNISNHNTPDSSTKEPINWHEVLGKIRHKELNNTPGLNIIKWCKDFNIIQIHCKWHDWLNWTSDNAEAECYFL